jgi:hypothetical protein
MRKITLVKPSQASKEIVEVYDDIVKTRGGKGWLPPIWGFFGKDPAIVKAMWGMIKRLEWTETKTPRYILVATALVGAQEVNCKRCVNFHQTQLIQKEGLTAQQVNRILNFEESYKNGSLAEAEYLALKLGECVALAKEFGDQDYESLTKHYSDEQIFEIIMAALAESVLSRYGSVMARFDQSDDWPTQFMLSAEYAKVVSK